MAIDESIFNFFFKSFTKGSEQLRQTKRLEAYSQRLEILASAIANTRIEIVGHDGSAYLSGKTLFLPTELPKDQDPFRHYLWLVLSALEWQNPSANGDVVTSLISTYPEHREEILSYAQALALPPKPTKVEDQRSANMQAPAVSKQQNVAVKTQRRPRSVDLKEENENPLVHTFEKIHSVDDYSGGQKRADGEDELSDHADALQEVTLSSVTRSAEPAHSSIDTDAWLETSPLQTGDDHVEAGRVFRYPEWSYRRRKYLKDWCRVYARAVPTTSVAAADSREFSLEGAKLKRLIEHFRNRMRWQRRLPDGSEIDLNAFVDVKADLLSHITPTSRFYMRKRKSERDVAFSILLDRSLSTDTYVQGVRVIELLKSCLNSLAYALKESDTPFSIAAYRSESRHNCYFDIIKTFSESWAVVPSRIHGLEPSGFTRVGPALRHATAEMARQPARKKVIVVLTDLKPTDYDFYEGPYGLLDVRKAVQESQSQGIFVFGLIVNQKRLMGGRHGVFPPGCFSYVRNQGEVLKGLEKIFVRAWS